MGQREISSTYHPDGAERMFLISHPVHVGLVIPRERDPRIAEVFRLFTEGDHQRLTDFALLYPHAGIITQGPGTEVTTTPESLVSDFLSQTFHKRGNESGRFGFQDLEGLEGIVIIASNTDADLVRAGLERGFKSEFAMLKDRVTLIEIGDSAETQETETDSHYRHVFMPKPRKIIELVDHMAELSIV